jgi:hypothetical protein
VHSWEDIYAIMDGRRERQSPIIKQMIEVRDRYNADWVLPNISAEMMTDLPPLSPQIIAETVDNYGMRAGSVLPSITCPAVNPTKQKGVNSRQYAKIRAGILMATYKHSRMQIQLRKAYRHMAGYATSAMVVLPDFKEGIPRIQLRDPLTSYPDPIAGEDFRNPENIGFIFTKSSDWIAYRYPQTKPILDQYKGGNEIMWNMVEWIDCDHIVIGLLGPEHVPNHRGANIEPIQWSCELKRWTNPLGCVSAICPSRVTLDRIGSQLANIIGMTDLMAKLTMLDVIAKEKSIFPDRYIMGKLGATPSIVGGQWEDGRTGKVNILLDADGIGSMNFASDPMATQAIDRLERNARVSSGLVPQMGGETYGALRTGRGIDALMGAAVDPRLMEMQVTMSVMLEYLNECVFKTYKEYFPNKHFVLPASWGARRPEADFTPTTHIETVSNEVAYPIPGADIQGTTIVLGQIQGMGLMSQTTARAMHPFIGDADYEKSLIDEETIENALLQSVMQQIAAGAASPMMLAMLEKARREDPDGDIVTALEKVQQQVQEQQATQAPPAPEGMSAPPETMPGVAPEMAQQAPPGIEGAPPDLANLRELLNALGQTSGVVQRR